MNSCTTYTYLDILHRIHGNMSAGFWILKHVQFHCGSIAIKKINIDHHSEGVTKYKKLNLS